MPLTVRCKKCKHILYDGDFKPTGNKKFNIFNIPEGIIKGHDEKCPKCGRKLVMPTWEDVKVSPAPGVNYIGKKRYESRQRSN